ncbi:D-amino-acid transaminase [Paracoccus seriniphilus]|uniref:Probable branched-chain-amino-acid aminotransferase n=1 Tax=Paracoccus seriniphilus TaxID=184748 RepID=A0A239PTW8_9RHOB|nr:D-amino-acid transaminase [Paracoccus seriniphilus]WCR16539.1 D-amino-acid transaminase [Paracoccus seriniphilus]SNT73751.1 D-alanine transaminase [Paracoccus seriniphilus]
MARQIFLNGTFVAEHEARVPVMDRGLLLGDAIYEVTAMLDGRMIDNDLHLARLQRSLSEVEIAMPMPLDQIAKMQVELVRRNAMRDGTIYMQVSRGVEERNFLPSAGLKPGFLAFTQPKKLDENPAQEHGVQVALYPDPRWDRRDIKTVMLLGQVRVKQQARLDGFDDVWMFEDGCVTEGASSSAFIVTQDGTIVTRPNSTAILPGCTRQSVMALATAHGMRVEEREIALEEISGVAEAFLTSASSLVQPVVRVGQDRIGDGVPGPVTRRLQHLYLDAARRGERVT